jgi:phosphoglycolate phosphatase
MIKAVVIDFDETLCLSEAVCFELENEVLGLIGREPMPRDIHRSTWGQALLDAIDARSPGVDVEKFKAAFPAVIAKYVASGKLDSIPNENYEALDKLVEMGMQLMILTSRTHEEAQHLLEPDHLLATRVKAFYYRDNMQYHKPDPRAFDELLKHTNLQPNQCVYVGDALSDAQAAKEAGLHFIASLESGIRVKEDFEGLSVDRFIQKFPEVVEAVKYLTEN